MGIRACGLLVGAGCAAREARIARQRWYAERAGPARSHGLDYDTPRLSSPDDREDTSVKKTIAVAALLISLVAIGCSSDSATPAPTEPAAALESLAAEASAAVEAVESAVAEEVEAVESAVAEEAEAVESAVAEEAEAVESAVAEEAEAVESAVAEAVEASPAS
jgi:hypothetical protein